LVFCEQIIQFRLLPTAICVIAMHGQWTFIVLRQHFVKFVKWSE